MSDIVIRAENLGKKYRISHETAQPYRTFRETLAKGFQRRRGSAHQEEEFWALRGVDFEIRRGDVVGVIGRNGAGKSTLLKILSRITEPTTGYVDLNGRVASLLEVGTGFHPELTGRENVYLNGSILGMRREEVRRKFDEIVSFAEVERFIDMPVKRYSSGMYMRLAFSVAAHLEPEILIVDEVLAVGDSAFQKKCLGRMEEVSAGGRTVLFVSHNLGTLLSICDKGILLDAGGCVANGNIRSVVKAYQQKAGSGEDLAPNLIGGPLKSVTFRQVWINGEKLGGSQFSPGEPIQIRVVGNAAEHLPEAVFTLSLYAEGGRLFTVEDRPMTLHQGEFSLQVEIPAGLLRPGDYSLALGARTAAELATPHDWCWGTDLASFELNEVWSANCKRDLHGMINVNARFTRENAPILERAAT